MVPLSEGNGAVGIVVGVGHVVDTVMNLDGVGDDDRRASNNRRSGDNSLLFNRLAMGLQDSGGNDVGDGACGLDIVRTLTGHNPGGRTSARGRLKNSLSGDVNNGTSRGDGGASSIRGTSEVRDSLIDYALGVWAITANKPGLAAAGLMDDGSSLMNNVHGIDDGNGIDNNGGSRSSTVMSDGSTSSITSSNKVRAIASNNTPNRAATRPKGFCLMGDSGSLNVGGAGKYRRGAGGAVIDIDDAVIDVDVVNDASGSRSNEAGAGGVGKCFSIAGRDNFGRGGVATLYYQIKNYNQRYIILETYPVASTSESAAFHGPHP